MFEEGYRGLSLRFVLGRDYVAVIGMSEARKQGWMDGRGKVHLLLNGG